MKKIFLFFAVIFASINSISNAEDSNTLNDATLAIQHNEDNLAPTITANVVNGYVTDAVVNHDNNNAQTAPTAGKTIISVFMEGDNMIPIFQNNGNSDILEQMKNEKTMRSLLQNNHNYKTEDVAIVKKNDFIQQNNTSTSNYYFNNSFFGVNGGISNKNMMMFDLYSIELGESIMRQQEHGNYDKDDWKLSGKDSFQFKINVGFGYAHSFTKLFKPYLGAYFVFQVPFSDHSYKKTLDDNYNKQGLKYLNINEDLGIEVGVKLGNVIETANSANPLLPYITIGYSNINWNMDSLEKVAKKVTTEVNGVAETEDKLEDKNDSVQGHATAHFATFGVGIEKYFLIFKIGLYAKYFHPLNSIMFKNEIGSLIDFGKHSHISVGVTLGITSLPLYF